MPYLALKGESHGLPSSEGGITWPNSRILGGDERPRYWAEIVNSLTIVVKPCLMNERNWHRNYYFGVIPVKDGILHFAHVPST